MDSVVTARATTYLTDPMGQVLAGMDLGKLYQYGKTRHCQIFRVGDYLTYLSIISFYTDKGGLQKPAGVGLFKGEVKVVKLSGGVACLRKL